MGRIWIGLHLHRGWKKLDCVLLAPLSAPAGWFRTLLTLLMEVWRDASKPFEIKRKVAAARLRPVESCRISGCVVEVDSAWEWLEMLTQIPIQSQPLENALPRHPAAPTPFPMQGLLTDGVREVQRALFTRKVSVVESPGFMVGSP